MSVFRVKKDKNYTVMSNSHLKEKEMSLKAIGLLSKMLSLPDDWDYSLAGLVSICKENETAIKSALDELKTFGYLEMIKKLPNETNTGRIEYEYIIYEKPKQASEKQPIEILPLEILPIENPGQLNTDKSNTNNKINNINIINNISKDNKLSKKKLKEIEKEKLNKELVDTINLYFDDIDIINLLNTYLDLRKTKGLTVAQWIIILEDFKKECASDKQYSINCLRKAIAGGWSQLIFLDNFKGNVTTKYSSKSNFDNTATHNVPKGISEMTDSEKQNYYANELAKDENGNFLKF